MQARGCELRNFVQPCVLLLLLDGPAHGYDLIRRLRPYGVTDGDPGHVYRALRSLERDRLVHSSWVPSAAGPARRVYHLTTKGRDALDSWTPGLEHVQVVVRHYLSEYAARTANERKIASVRSVQAISVNGREHRQ